MSWGLEEAATLPTYRQMCEKYGFGDGKTRRESFKRLLEES
ncbi:MAG: hypothetical protein ACLRZ5_18865 [Ruminococcus sp.]